MPRSNILGCARQVVRLCAIALILAGTNAYAQTISVSPSVVMGGTYVTLTVSATSPPGDANFTSSVSAGVDCCIFGAEPTFYGGNLNFFGTTTQVTTFVQQVAQPTVVTFYHFSCNLCDPDATATVTVLPQPAWVLTVDNSTLVGNGSSQPAAHLLLQAQGLYDFRFLDFSSSDPCAVTDEQTPCSGGNFQLPSPPQTMPGSLPIYTGTVTKPTNVTLTLSYEICINNEPSQQNGTCSPDDGFLTASLQVTVVPPPPTDLGPCTECEGDTGLPISVSTGDVWVSHTDYSVPGLAGGLSLGRTWNSLWSTNNPPFTAGMFGMGWTSQFEERLQFLSSGNVNYWLGSGNTWTFQPNGSSGYTQITPPNQHAALSFNSTTNLYTIAFANGTTKTFNATGYLTAMQDRNANLTTVSYDQSQRITQVTAPGGQWISFTYGLAGDPGRVTSIQDSVGTVATYTYNNGLLTSVTYADGSQNNYAYDTANNITSVTDGQAKILESHTYDSAHRGLTSSRANGVDSISLQYGSDGTTTLTDSMNNTTIYSYAALSGSTFITQIQGPGCHSCGGRNNQTFVLDSSGNRTSETDPNGNAVSYTYDSSGNILTKSNAAGTWTYTYNGFQEALTAQDPLANTTTNTYDSQGNLLTTTTPPPASGQSGSQTIFTYDATGELLTATDPLGHKTTLSYFPGGLLHTITDAQSNAISYTYDARGNKLTVKDPLNQATSFAYDPMNRLLKITYPDSSTAQFAYDPRGREVSVTDANNETTTYTYDDADRLITSTDPTHNVTTYGYDSESNMTSVKDASGHITSFGYDSLGRVTQTTFPSNLAETYGYDANGNLTSKTDRNSHTITYAYDQLNRLTSKTYPDSSTVTFTYDSDGRLTREVDPTGTYQFVFDNMGRPTQSTASYAFLASRSFTNSYGYDAGSNLTSFTDPEGGATTYAYDTLNRLQTLTPPSAFTRSSFGFTYDALSRLTQLARPNKVNTTYGYDSLSRILSVKHATTKATLDGTTYTLGAVGNRLTRTPLPTGTATSYSYDPAYQLLSAAQSGASRESYTYDAAGNRLTSLSGSYAYNSSNEMTSTPAATFTYDNNGNIVAKTDSTGTTSYSWDFENRLTSVTLPGTGGTVMFKYDPFGRRIYKSSSSGTSIYAYDAANLIEETNSSGVVIARYSHGPNIDEPLAMLRASATSYYHADGLGSITSITNSSGAVANTYVYDSFGNLTSSSGTLTNPFRYTGREFDNEDTLYYYRSRYYDPTSGRFLSEDATGFDAGPNFYVYVHNNPTRFTDPYGKDIWVEGPSGGEPNGHMSINVGDPNGTYSSYSFGYDQDLPGFFPGEVYQDTSHGGDFLPGHYLRATPTQDALAKAYLDSMLGERAPYRPWRTCRTFSLQQFQHFKDIGLGTPASPPARQVDPRDRGRYVPGLIGTTATDRQSGQNWIQRLLRSTVFPMAF